MAHSSFGKEAFLVDEVDMELSGTKQVIPQLSKDNGLVSSGAIPARRAFARRSAKL
jgi:hypothetical protein